MERPPHGIKAQEVLTTCKPLKHKKERERKEAQQVFDG